MAKKSVGPCGLDLLLDAEAFSTAIEAVSGGPSLVVLVGDDAFINRQLLTRLRKQFCPNEEDWAWAWREFSGEEQPDPRDVLDEAATVPMFASATRSAVVRRADGFVSSCRNILESIADRPRGSRGLVILEVRSFPATTRLAKAVGRHGLAISSSIPTHFNLTRWLQVWAEQTHQVELPVTTASRLLERLGNELGQIDQALTSLVAALPSSGPRKITPEAVDTIGGSGAQRTAWEMLDAAAAGRTDEAIALLTSLLEAGENPIGLAAQSASVFRRYATAARLLAGPNRPSGIPAALREAGVAAWPKALAEAERALRHLGSQRCRQLPGWLEATDRSLKAEASRGLRARLALERFFCKMAGSAPPVPPRPTRRPAP